MSKGEDAKNRSSLAKGVSLWRVVAEHGGNGMTASAAARRAAISMATAHRLLGVLVDEGFLCYDPYTRCYSLGILPYRIIARVGTDLPNARLQTLMRPALYELHETLGGIVSLNVLSGKRALCIDVIAERSVIQVTTLKVGSQRPLGVGGGPLALLAGHPAKQREAIIRRERDKYTKYGALTVDYVRAEIARYDRYGYVVNDIVVKDIAGIAVPFYDEHVTLSGSVSFTDLIPRIDRISHAKIVASLRQAVEKLGFSTWHGREPWNTSLSFPGEPEETRTQIDIE